MEKTFKIRAYGRTELALAYCPEITPQSAYRKLSAWIDRSPQLRSRLAALSASSRSRWFTPAQVQAIVEAIGEP